VRLISADQNDGLRQVVVEHCRWFRWLKGHTSGNVVEHDHERGLAESVAHVMSRIVMLTRATGCTALHGGGPPSKGIPAVHGRQYVNGVNAECFIDGYPPDLSPRHGVSGAYSVHSVHEGREDDTSGCVEAQKYYM
jgi:hypothetical protein